MVVRAQLEPPAPAAGSLPQQCATAGDTGPAPRAWNSRRGSETHAALLSCDVLAASLLFLISPELRPLCAAAAAAA